MESSVPGLQPSSLSSEELLKYARLHNNTGLPKHWVDAILDQFERALDRASTAEELLQRREDEVAELQEELDLRDEKE